MGYPSGRFEEEEEEEEWARAEIHFSRGCPGYTLEGHKRGSLSSLFPPFAHRGALVFSPSLFGARGAGAGAPFSGASQDASSYFPSRPLAEKEAKRWGISLLFFPLPRESKLSPLLAASEASCLSLASPIRAIRSNYSEITPLSLLALAGVALSAAAPLLPRAELSRARERSRAGRKRRRRRPGTRGERR